MGPNKIKKNVKIKIRVAQNVGKVWISRKKLPWPHFGATWAQFFHGLDPKKIHKITILKIKIRSAQNVGKVWISRKKILLARFGAIWAHFLRGPEKKQKMLKFCLFSLAGQWA